jgi:molybdate transport system substrate-binding protein
MTPIKVLSSTAIREALDMLVPMFEQAGGRKVALTFEPITELVKTVRAGVTTDAVMTARDSLETLMGEGKLTPGTWTPFVLSRVGVAVRQGAPRPDIGTPEAFKAALLAAKSVGISKGPSGGHAMNALAKLGIADEIKAKAVIPDISIRIGTLVANGEAEIGLQQIGELLPMPGIEFIGPLPKELQALTAYGAARSVNAADWTGAQEFLRFITMPDKGPMLQKIGLELG